MRRLIETTGPRSGWNRIWRTGFVVYSCVWAYEVLRLAMAMDHFSKRHDGLGLAVGRSIISSGITSAMAWWLVGAAIFAGLAYATRPERLLVEAESPRELTEAERAAIEVRRRQAAKRETAFNRASLRVWMWCAVAMVAVLAAMFGFNIASSFVGARR